MVIPTHCECMALAVGTIIEHLIWVRHVASRVGESDVQLHDVDGSQDSRNTKQEISDMLTLILYHFVIRIDAVKTETSGGSPRGVSIFGTQGPL